MNISNEKIKKLKSLFEKIQVYETPNFFDEAPADEILEKILDIDPYYAGLAQTVSEGGRIDKNDLLDLKTIEKEITHIKTDKTHLLEKWKGLLALIVEIDSILRES